MYRDGVFQTSFSEADADLFGANQRSFGFRWMELDASSKELMSTIISSLRELQPTLQLENPKAIDVARAIISFFDNLRDHFQNTHTAEDQLKLRDILKNANDPQDLPSATLRAFETIVRTQMFSRTAVGACKPLLKQNAGVQVVT